MAGRVQHVETQALDFDAVAFGHPHRDDVGLGIFAHHRNAAGAVAQRAEPGDVVGVEMGIDSLDQFQVELADELQIAVDLFQHRIDDQRFPAQPAGKEIGVGPGGGVEELAKNHALLPLRRLHPHYTLRHRMKMPLRHHYEQDYPAKGTGTLTWENEARRRAVRE